jgi:hypothetical protein
MKVPVRFTVNELWALDALVPETPNVRTMVDMAPFRKGVALAIAECAEEVMPEAVVELSEDYCRIISQAVSSSLISPAGQSIGRSILIKTYRAWRHIDEGKELGVAGKPLSETDRARELEDLYKFKQAQPPSITSMFELMRPQHPGFGEEDPVPD